jgi:hypothetical protein
MTEVDNGTSDVAAVEADSAIDVNEGPVFELDNVPPECDGAIWVSNDGPGGFEGRGFACLSNPFESIDMFDKRSAASSVSFPLPTSPRSFISLLVSLGIAPVLPTEPRLLPPPHQSYSSQKPICPTSDSSPMKKMEMLAVGNCVLR